MIEPTGYTALDLIGFTDRGEYDPDAYYVKNDIATVGNTKWRCKIDDTTGITPTEGANWTIYLESATSLAGMSDVTLTSPKNGDGLVHDGNDWKNVPIVTQAMQTKLGATNLAPNDATTQVIGGVTFSIDKTNSDTNGIITLSGTASEAITLVLGKFKVPIGSYVLSSKADGSKARVTVEAYNGNTWKRLLASTASNDNVSFNADFADYDTLWMSVRIDSGTNVNGIVVKPMVSVTAGEYAPHAKTNRELTKDVNIEEITITPASGVTIDYKSCMKQGKMVTLNCRFVISSTYSFSTNGLIASINYHPKQTNLVPTFKTWAGTTGGLLRIDPNGSIVTPDASTFTAGSYVINVCFIVD